MIRGVMPKHDVRFGSLDRLSKATDQYCLFTPAILYLWCGFTDDTLWDFVEAQDHDVKFMFHRFAKPIFSGLRLEGGDADWNHSLWLMERPDWDEFEKHLLTLLFVDPGRGFVAKPGIQSMEIMDPLLVDKGEVLSPHDLPVDILAIGWDGSNGVIGFDLEGGPPNKPSVKRFSANPERVADAEYFFQEHKGD